MNYKILLLTLWLGALVTNSSQAQTPTWQQAILVALSGTTPTSNFRAVDTDASGNVFVTGSFTGSAIFGGTTLTAAGTGSCAFLAKWNPTTSTWVWAVQSSGSNTTIANALVVKGNSIYIAGYFNTAATIAGQALSANGSTYDLFIAKYVDNGTTVADGWAVRGGGTAGTDRVWGLAVNGTTIYATGYFTGSVTIAGQSLASPGGDNNDVFLAKYIDNGTSVGDGWAVRAGTSGIDQAYAVAVEGTNVYITGNYRSGTGNFTVGGTTLPAADAGGDLFLAKYIDNGTSAGNGWGVKANGTSTSDDRGMGLVATTTDVYVAGYYAGQNFTISGATLTNTSAANSQNLFLARFTAAGGNGWAIGNSAGGASTQGLSLVKSGNALYVAGVFMASVTLGSQTLTGTNATVFLAKCTDNTSSASIDWALSGGGSGSDQAYAVTVSPAGAWVVGNITPPATFGDYTIGTTGPTQQGMLLKASIPVAAPTLTGLAATTTSVCAGSPISFTATVGNVSGNYSYTLTNGTSLTTGTTSTTTLSQNLTAAGSGLQTFTLTVSSSAQSATATTTLTVSTPSSATIAYVDSPYCTNDAPGTVTRTGTAGGTYSAAPSGLSINASTGQIIPASSSPGTYTITYTMAANGSCAPTTATTSVTVTAPPSATIAYAGTPFCTSAAPVSVTPSGTIGGTYSASPAGLSLNASTGLITPATSSPGSYTVTYTMAGTGGCAQNTATASVTITAPPSATIAYTGSPFLPNASPVSVSRTGTSGGTYTASPTGLSINASTGQITPASSSPGTYTVTYTVAASGGCAVYSTTALVRIQANAADLAITITNGVTSVTAGSSSPVTYTISVSNSGPLAVSTATITSTFPASLTNITWVGTATGGATVTAAGVGTINDQVALPVGGIVTYQVTAFVRLAATGTISTTATVTVPNGITDPNPANNSATDSDVVIPASPTIQGLAATANPICVGSSTVFTATVGQVSNSYSYTLTNGSSSIAGSSTSNAFSQSVVTTGSGVQTFTLLVSSNGQPSSATTSLTVNALPALSVSPASATLTNANPTTSLTAIGTGNFTWSTGQTSPAISVTASGIYSVTLTNASGCSSTASVPVTGSDLTLTLDLPQANFAASGTASVGNFVVNVFEVGGLPTSSGTVRITVTAPVGYTVAFPSSLTSIQVSGGGQTAVNNAQWVVSTNLDNRQLTLIMASGAFIGAGGTSNLGLSMTRTTANSGSTANITVNVSDDQTMTYDGNLSNNVYARIISGL